MKLTDAQRSYLRAAKKRDLTDSEVRAASSRACVNRLVAKRLLGRIIGGYAITDAGRRALATRNTGDSK